MVHGQISCNSSSINSVNQVRCLYTNANCLSNKHSELQGRIDLVKPDIIGITEVWEKEEYALEGYHQAFRKDRPASKLGGGVMLLVKDNLQVMECNELNTHDFIEAVWCKVKFSRQDSLLIGVCYRSPRCTKEQNEKLNELLRKTQLVQARDIMIMGDFNYGEIDWENEVTCGPDDSDASKFLEVVQDLYLSQHVHQPTRFREGQMPSRLDLVLTNDKNMVDNIEIGEPLGKSDHVVITWDFKFRPSSINARKAPTKKNFNFFKTDFSGMRNALQSTDWNILNNLGVEKMWSHIKDVIQSNIASHVPAHGKRKFKPAAPWWNNKQISQT